MTEDLGDLKTVAPAGSPPASGSGCRGAGPEPDAHTCSPQLGTFGGQGTGALERLLEYLEDEAANMDALATPMEGEDPRIRESAERYAAEYREWASAVRDAIGAPRPQSGEEGAEECRVANNSRLCAISNDWRIPGDRCLACPARGKRVERSGPPNASISARSCFFECASCGHRFRTTTRRKSVMEYSGRCDGCSKVTKHTMHWLTPCEHCGGHGYHSQNDAPTRPALPDGGGSPPQT